MTDRTFWHNLAEEFKSLDPGQALSIGWQYTSGAPGHYSYQLDGGTDLLRLRFKRLAQKAVLMLHEPDNRDSFEVWCDMLRKSDKDPRNEGPLVREKLNDEIYITHQKGRIPKACEASAILCIALEIQEAEIQRETAPEYPPTVVDASRNRILDDRAEALRKLQSELKDDEGTPERDLEQSGLPASESAEVPPTMPGTQPSRGLDWVDVKIRFLSDERVEVRTPDQDLTMNYAEMGLEDARTGSYNKAWLTLTLLAQSDGIISVELMKGRKRANLEKQIQALRRKLRKHFGIEGDPLLFVDGVGYQAAFKITWSPAAET